MASQLIVGIDRTQALERVRRQPPRVGRAPDASVTNGGTVAAAINNSGEIAGFFTDIKGTIHGFIDIGGMFKTIDPKGATETELLGLNNKGLAVGLDIIAGRMHGFIYNPLTNAFISVDDPNALCASCGTTFNGINDRNQVVGFFVDGHGNTDGLLATIPEPGTWAMMIAGFVGLGYVGFRRSRKNGVALASA